LLLVYCLFTRNAERTESINNGTLQAAYGRRTDSCRYFSWQVQKVKKSVASNSSIFNISGAMYPGSSADTRSSSTSLNHSVDGSSFSMSVHSSASCSHIEPSVSGTASGSLLKSHLTSKNPQVGSAYRDQVPRVAQQTGNKVICFIFFVGHLLKHG